MTRRTLFTLFLFCAFSSPAHPASGDETNPEPASTCLHCHAAKRDGFSAAHAFGANDCIGCHAGDNGAVTEDGAHDGLIAFPGDLSNAGRACGSCHAERVASVASNLMHTGTGIVRVTRQLLDASAGPEETVNFQSLGHSVGDSMLRKLCASCHLGQEKTEHELDVMQDRGGGCLACHINDYPENAHPSLTAGVSDARCFGCHSRSGRISLSYTGLAEIDAHTKPDEGAGPRLPDGRHIERKPADIHYLAGMSCIDCHTSVGLMGGTGDVRHQREAVDIECSDCHDNGNRKIGLSEWPADLASMVKHIPFVTNDETAFLTTRKNGTPLWNIELRGDGPWLRTKNTGLTLAIPGLDAVNHAEDANHERLACAACHSQWAPQCFGCHMEYDTDGSQWDHIERAVTSGRWRQQRSHVRNEPGTLGVNERNRVEVFVPGMIMTVAHPDWNREKFFRVFAPLSPHTTGGSRSCESCHRSSVALGLGQGTFVEQAGDRRFRHSHEALQDGLPGDAWTNLDNTIGGDTPVPGQRPLSKDEMEAVLAAPLP